MYPYVTRILSGYSVRVNGISRIQIRDSEVGTALSATHATCGHKGIA